MYQCLIVKFSKTKRGIKLEKQTGSADFSAATKIMRNGCTMYTTNSKKVKQQNSYTIKLNNEVYFALEAENFFL